MKDDRYDSFKDYLEAPEGKFVIAITKYQSVFCAEPVGDHAIMAADIIKEIRPDLEIDGWGNTIGSDDCYREHNIFIFGYPHYSLVCLPSREKISPEQYKELEEILQNIKEYNDKNPYNRWELDVDAPEETNIKSDNYETKIDELLMLLESYITDDYKAPQETIIGKPISKNEHLQQYKNSI